MPLGLQGGVINPEICNRPSPEPGRWMVSDRGGSLPPTAGQDAPAGVTAPPSCFWDLCLAPLAPGGETLDPCLQDGDNNSTSLQIEVRSR